MSTNSITPQMSPGEAFRSLTGSAPKLAALAAACMLLFLLLPAMRVTGSFLGFSSAVSFTGSEMGGWTAWIALLAFGAAAATRFVPAIMQYRRIADLAVFGTIAAVLIYAFLASPVATAAQQVHQTQAQMGGLIGGDFGRNMGNGFGRAPAPVPPPVSFSVLPHVGALFLVLAPVLLFMAKRRARGPVLSAHMEPLP